MPSLIRHLGHGGLAPNLVRVNTSTWLQLLLADDVREQAAFFCLAAPRGAPDWVMRCDRGVARRDVDALPGCAAGLWPASRMSSLKVAENIRFCAAWAAARAPCVTSRMKPMSSMRSASSSTRISTLERSSVRCWPAWSSRRPGVATRMSTPRLRARSICGLMLTPPKINGATSSCRVLAVGRAPIPRPGPRVRGWAEHQGARRRCRRTCWRRCGSTVAPVQHYGRVKAAVLPVSGLGAGEKVDGPRGRPRNGLGLDGGRGFRSPVRARPSRWPSQLQFIACHCVKQHAPYTAR